MILKTYEVITRTDAKQAVNNHLETLHEPSVRRQLGIMITRGDQSIKLWPEHLSKIQFRNFVAMRGG